MTKIELIGALVGAVLIVAAILILTKIGGWNSMSITLKLGQRVGRKQPCPCGSGKKYKSCCYADDREAAEHRKAWNWFINLKGVKKWPGKPSWYSWVALAFSSASSTACIGAWRLVTGQRRGRPPKAISQRKPPRFRPSVRNMETSWTQRRIGMTEPLRFSYADGVARKPLNADTLRGEIPGSIEKGWKMPEELQTLPTRCDFCQVATERLGQRIVHCPKCYDIWYVATNGSVKHRSPHRIIEETDRELFH